MTPFYAVDSRRKAAGARFWDEDVPQPDGVPAERSEKDGSGGVFRWYSFRQTNFMVMNEHWSSWRGIAFVQLDRKTPNPTPLP